MNVFRRNVYVQEQADNSTDTFVSSRFFGFSSGNSDTILAIALHLRNSYCARLMRGSTSIASVRTVSSCRFAYIAGVACIYMHIGCLTQS